MRLNYTKIGDYFLPNLTIKEQKGTINKYGYLRLNYLKKHKKCLYMTLLMEDELTNHLVSVSNEAENKVDFLIKNYKETYKLTEKRKRIMSLNGSKLLIISKIWLKNLS